MFLASVGTLRAVMLCVDFPDAPAAEAPPHRRDPEAYFDFLVPGAQRFFHTSSFGRLRLDLDLCPRWWRLAGGHDIYGFRRGIAFETHARYIRSRSAPSMLLSPAGRTRPAWGWAEAMRRHGKTPRLGSGCA